MIVRYTPTPRWVATTGPCNLSEVMEIRHLRSVRLTLRLVDFKEPSTPLLWVAMETSLDPEDGYASLGRFDTLSRPGTVSTVNFDDVMRYVRWNVVSLEGATAACFTLEGAAGG